MTGEDFLNLAIRLANSDSEADIRTSVSRSYYGAFHIGLEFLERCGIQLPRSADAHEKLQWCLDQAAHVDANDAALKLESLRAERNAADYDLRSSKFKSRRNALVAIRVAQDIVGALAACGREPAFVPICENIRTYARNVLRLPDSEP